MLTPTDRAVLALERLPWRHEGPKLDRARRDLGLTPTRYYQALNRLLDDADAEACAPMVVHRLRRVRAARPRRAGTRLAPPAPSHEEKVR